MKNLIFCTAMILVFVACNHKQKVMDVSIVSMTYNNLPEATILKESGPVTGSFCASEGDRGTIGLFDEAVKSAQHQNSVDFITNATFWRENSCITLEGTGQKIATANDTVTKTHHKKKK